MNSRTMTVDISMEKLDRRFIKAQYALDSQVMADITPLMPMQTGTFINLTRARSAATAGTGKVCAAAPPYGRFLYYGKVMVDPVTNSPWARKGAKKVVTEKDLVLNRGANPGAQAKWFEVAKQLHEKEWFELVGNILEGKKNGK